MIGRLLKSVLRVLTIVVVSVEIIGVTCIDYFMFHPEMVRESYDTTWSGFVDLGTPGDRIAAVVLGPEDGRKAILRCHGNAESMYQSIEVLRKLADRGCTVAAVDYPGYGLSDGRPTEKGCYRNVHRLYDYLVKERGFRPEDVIVDGFSIGTGPATELAATEKVGGLILEAPFLSAPRAVTRVRLLPIDPFPNAIRVERGIACPMLVFHGTEDSVIPFGQGRQIFDLAQETANGQLRKFIPVDGADHNEIADALGLETYLDMVSDFAFSRGQTL